MGIYHSREIFAADIETTGLIDDLLTQTNPKLHNLGLIDSEGKEELFEGSQEDEIQDFLDSSPVLLMHSGITYDAVALDILGYDTSNITIIDTLMISHYLEPRRKRYGLADYGEEFGIPKPVIEDWNNQTQEEYNFRVMQDCRIQRKLWQKQYNQLKAIYRTDEKVERFVKYLMFKSKQQKVQQDCKWKLDVDGATELKDTLQVEFELKTDALRLVMPRVPVYGSMSFPKKPYKKDGSLSAQGTKWIAMRNKCGFGKGHTEELIFIKGDKEPNPNSHVQIKDWLYSLGWKPETFKYKRDKETGDSKAIPQVNIDEGELCPSIMRLIPKTPGLESLRGLGIVKHRLGLVKGLLRDEVDGYLIARYSGLTNTLRLKHVELVNLPSTRVLWGKEIRALLLADDGYTLLGADLSSLEDRCKHHFQMPYDPEYVKTQMASDFDPHLLICEMAKLLTSKQVLDHKAGIEDYGNIRHFGKSTNYSCQYGAGGETVARAAGVAKEMGFTLRDTYWELNWSILEIAKNTVVKTIDGQLWQENPVNGFWYSLRAQKDRFSTLCQGTGAYIFDMWLWKVFDICEERFGRSPNLLGQFHDEMILMVKDSEKSKKGWTKIMKQAMERLNDELGMNREMDSDVQFGKNYSLIH